MIFNNSNTIRPFSDRPVSKRIMGIKTRKLLQLERYSNIQRLFLKIQYKLFAVIAFKKMMRPGLNVTSLNVKNCHLRYFSITIDIALPIDMLLSFSPTSALLLRLALLDQSTITDLDLSDNPDLFSLVPVYQELEKNADPANYETFINSLGGPSILLQPLGDITMQFYYILAQGTLRHLRLNNCGLTESNMEMLSQALMKSSLQSLQISDNKLGPTSFNWITTALGEHFLSIFVFNILPYAQVQFDYHDKKYTL